MDKIEMMHELCDTIFREIEDCNEKIRSAGGKLSPGDIDYLDKLTHAVKSIKTTVAMMEADDGGYSSRYMMPRYAYADGDRSYARKRDGMGRYSRGYSYAEEIDGIMDELRSVMGKMPDDKRRKVQRFMDDMM